MLRDQFAETLEANALLPQEETLRRKVMVRTILTLMGAALLVFTIPIVLGTLSGFFDVLSSLIILLIDVPVGLGWWLSRRGYWRPGSYLAPALMFMLGLYGSALAGLSTSFVLFYALAILLVSLLLDNRAMWYTLALVLIVHLGLGLIRLGQPVEEALPAVITFTGGLLGQALLQSYASRQITQALAQAHTTTARLRTEIAERARVEEALRASQAVLHSLIESLPQNIFSKDTQGRFIFANQRYCATEGKAAHELVGQTDRELHPPELAEKYRADDQHVMESGQTIELVEEHQPLGKEKFYVQVIKAPLVDAHGIITGTLGIFWDITDQRRAAQERDSLIAELQAKNEELERFTYTVSHDLKAPLITIRGFLGLLEQDARTGQHERMQADMQRINEATERMRRLLDELLELSRVGRMMNAPQEISFEAIAREAIELLDGRLKARAVHVHIAPGLPTVYGDRLRLVEVIQNLVDNAVKFMGNQPSPRIEIGAHVSETPGQTVFFVQDNGIGLEPHFYEKVFGLFNKLDARSEGTGVGLALVKRIIEVHDGRVWVESPGLQGGTTFYFTLAAAPLPG
ncbi:two-component system, OmpR family, sensor histidine kinase VicK [Thermoflexales bacterium]|nr:two-component system, OmpR family, sensor histidine kinase VicK [Thermoflexales bacterium]